MAGGIGRRNPNGEWYAEDLDDLLDRVEALEAAVEELQNRSIAPATAEPASEEDRMLREFFLSVIRGAVGKAPAPAPAVQPAPVLEVVK